MPTFTIFFKDGNQIDVEGAALVLDSVGGTIRLQGETGNTINTVYVDLDEVRAVVEQASFGPDKTTALSRSG